MKDLRIVYVDDNDRIQFGLQNVQSPVEGPSRLVQKILKLLFTRTNSDAFHPNWGSTFADVIGSSFAQDQDTEIRAYIIFAIRHIEDLIKTQQASLVSLDRNERLREIEILKTEYSEAEMSWEVEISVITETGRAFFARL